MKGLTGKWVLFLDTVDDRIQNAILTASDSIQNQISY